jgi:iron-sulfur cluster repair protein YtfE (RIC family)
MIQGIADMYIKIGVTGVLVVLFVWWIICQVKNQQKTVDAANLAVTKVNETILNLFKDEVKELKLLTKQSIEVGCDNTKINKEITSLINRMHDSLVRHSQDSNANMRALLPAFNKLIDNLNGGNPAVVKLREDLDEIKKKLDKSS